VPAGYTKTGVATDLAVSGPAYFVLATKAEPTAVEDLLFTRNGHFALKLETPNPGGPSLQWLKHSDGAFYVLGFSHPETTTYPEETSGINESILTVPWGTATAKATGLGVDAQRNPDAGSKMAFTATGLMQINGQAPFDADGATRLTKYVALAQFEHPESLSAVSGFDGVYRFNPNAGRIFLGVAVSGTGRPVGAANLIIPATLEGH
jgi:hypothetical protein